MLRGKGLLGLVATVAIFVGGLCLWPSSNYAKITPGMSRSEVHDLLGSTELTYYRAAKLEVDASGNICAELWAEEWDRSTEDIFVVYENLTVATKTRTSILDKMATYIRKMTSRSNGT